MSGVKKITEIKGENIFAELESNIKEVYDFLKDKDLLVINRRMRGNFLSIFADSLYSYEKGVIMLERFYKKSKCKTKGMEYKIFDDNGRKTMSDFREFVSSISDNVAKMDESEKEDINKKIKDYQKKIKDIKVETSVVNTYVYNSFSLSEIDKLDEEDIVAITKISSNFAINFLTFITWDIIKDIPITLSTIEYDDYIDLVLFPVKVKEAE